MFLDSLKTVYQNNKNKNPAYIRNVLKENIQYFLLQFISQSIWGEQFIFKGGTCLRFFFDLPRLSEDLDFDILNISQFEMPLFINKLEAYFVSTLQYKQISTKLATNQRTLYIKFPILADIGMPLFPSESRVLFVRIDMAPVIGKNYLTEISIKTTYNFSFLVKRYSLPDLFSGKIAAILAREAFTGIIKKERLKGRDFYDLIWFLEKNVRPNWQYLNEITGFTRKLILEKLKEKMTKIDPLVLEADLTPFFPDNTFVRSFSRNIQNLASIYLKQLA